MIFSRQRREFEKLFATLDRRYYPEKLKKVFYKDYLSFLYLLEKSFKNTDGKVLAIGATSTLEQYAIKKVMPRSELHVLDEKTYDFSDFVDLFLNMDLHAFRAKGVYDHIIARHFPINQQNSEQLFQLAKKNGFVFATFYYQHEFHEFLRKASGFEITARGKNRKAFEIKNRQQILGTPIIMNDDSVETEISKRDKYVGLVKI